MYQDIDHCDDGFSDEVAGTYFDHLLTSALSCAEFGDAHVCARYLMEAIEEFVDSRDIEAHCGCLTECESLLGYDLDAWLFDAVAQPRSADLPAEWR